MVKTLLILLVWQMHAGRRRWLYNGGYNKVGLAELVTLVQLTVLVQLKTYYSYAYAGAT